MRILSKSKLMAFRQCPKRLWMEIHRPELREDSAATEAGFSTGFQVGDMAHRLFDPDGRGELLDAQAEGYEAALARSLSLLQWDRPLFEAGFRADGALAFADVMLPVNRSSGRGWRMIEVKSSTSVKDYHRDDVAVQAMVARAAGVNLEGIAVAHINSSWTYPGNGDYRGLLQEVDLTAEAFGRTDEVRQWIADAQQIATSSTEPETGTGGHCWEPFECGFRAYCSRAEPQPDGTARVS